MKDLFTGPSKKRKRVSPSLLHAFEEVPHSQVLADCGPDTADDELVAGWDGEMDQGFDLVRNVKGKLVEAS